MRKLYALLALAAFALPAPAADPWAPVKRPGIEETAVPCEVQANRKAACCQKCGDDCRCVGGCGCEVQAKAARCRTCGESCDCYGTCVCDREAAVRASAQPRPGRSAEPAESAEARTARLRAVQVRTPFVDRAGNVLYHRVWTIGEYLDAGHDIGQVQIPDADKAFLKAAPPAVVRIAPMPAPAPTFSAGWNYSGRYFQAGAQYCSGST